MCYNYYGDCMDVKSLSTILTTINNNIIIAGHKDADYDSMCSSLALALTLRQLNKNVKVYIEKDSVDRVKYFNCDDLLCSDFHFHDYTFIALDLNQISRLPIEIQDCYLNATTKINIDHHEGNEMKANYILTVNDISSTCEIIYNIIKALGVKINKSISELLFTGIVSDTKLFVNRTSSDTFAIVSELLKKDIDNNYLVNKFYLEKTDVELQMIAYIIDNLKFDDFHYAVLDMTNPKVNKIIYSEISKKCIPTIVSGNDIDVLMIIMDYGSERKGEIRSKTVNVRELAELLNGGGHAKAAGFTTNKTVEEILTIGKKFLK